ncbi:putative chitobiose transport system substrate-binding protein [Thermocatellispora tengchongensis]|uniref:Putative chitobiose transport system substrate-binding protein n=1 Tax=Thermocatellispora tengchongensis TaxID=1073253 RepID=A0A840P2H6_9ACTN|nr:ABC transporter substrate-binding protein [Thermocatellispora tengchongensis]MBB5133562.1 putative chitobiose transport system substrate-binding protein [Thermocatellispora tengchongensis]
MDPIQPTRRRLLTGGALALVAGLVSACGVFGGTGGGPDSAGGSGPVSLEFWTINLKEGYTPYIEGAIRRYEQDHPGVTVKWVDIPDFEQTQSKLLAAISGGATPDVVNMTPFILPKFAATNTIYPIDELAPDPAAVAAEYTPGLWDAGVIGGKAYAIPFYGSVSALIYNTELFREAGLDPDKPPADWDEVFAAAKRIHAETGVSGFVQTLDDFNDAGNPSDILAGQAGAPLLSPDGKTAAFATPEAVAHLEQYAAGVKDGWIERTSVNGGVMDGAKVLAQEKTAMVFLGPWILRWLEDNTEPETFEKFRVAAHPEGAGGAANGFLQQFAIPRASKNPKQALDFARYFSTTTLELAKQAPVLPALTATAKDPYFQSSPETKVLVEQEVKFYWPKHPAVAELFTALRTEFQAALLGRKTAKAALDDAAREWNRILSAGQ